MIKTHYGLHYDGNLTFLHERGRSRCLTPGFEQLPSPFKVVSSLPCPHHLPEPAPGDIPDHPLVRAMSPVSDAAAYQIDPRYRQMVGRMNGQIAPIWAIDQKRFPAQLLVTNAMPLVLLGVEADHYTTVQRILTLPRQRTLVIVSSLGFSEATKIDGAGLDGGDWRAAILHRHVLEVAHATA